MNPRTYLAGCALAGLLAADTQADLGFKDAAEMAVKHADAIMDVMGCCQYKDGSNRRCLRATVAGRDFCEYHPNGHSTHEA